MFLLVAATWPARSLAQPPRTEAPRSEAARSEAPRANPEAQARFEAGVAAYEQRRYREAIERFKEADQLAPSPLLSFNIAKVYERLSDNRGALAWYRDYLRRLPEADNRASVLERVAVLERALRATGVQQLTVLSSPAGATVSIDNVTRGVAPWTGELIPGPHTLALSLPGYRDSVAEIELPADHAIDIQTALVPQPPSAPARPEPARAPRPAAPLAPEHDPSNVDVSWGPRWWTWAMFGGAAAGFVAAGAFELARSDMERQAREEQVQVEHQQKFERMQDRQTLARVFVGVGAVALVAGGLSLYFDWRSAEAVAQGVALGCDGAGCTLAAGGRF